MTMAYSEGINSEAGVAGEQMKLDPTPGYDDITHRFLAEITEFGLGLNGSDGDAVSENKTSGINYYQASVIFVPLTYISAVIIEVVNHHEFHHM